MFLKLTSTIDDKSNRATLHVETTPLAQFLTKITFGLWMPYFRIHGRFGGSHHLLLRGHGILFMETGGDGYPEPVTYCATKSGSFNDPSIWEKLE